MLKGKTIVIGVSGGIAVYKVCDLVSKLKKLNADVHVIMTKSATEFVAPLTFQSLSWQPVIVDMFDKIVQWDIEHIALAKSADLFLVAPATANIIGKIANGIADDMLSTTIMATKAPIVIAPAMNTNMYQNPIVQDNIKKLKNHGYKFIKPDSGRLACGDLGIGKLANVDTIIESITMNLLDDKPFAGQKILITAGPTREALDPVRYMTNHSSGKMGYSIAEAAVIKGAEVTLISGPVTLEKPNNLKKYIQIESAEEMFTAVKDNLKDQNIIIKSAAVADYRPEVYVDKKIKKSDDDFKLTLTRNPDILKWIGMHKTPEQLIVGFAAETNDVMENGISKLKKKNIDMIIVNDVTRADAGFGTDTNCVTLIDKKGNKKTYPVMPKKQLAHSILDYIIANL
ncbi:bifunctional phosphopantothenoylcysteine decarboxylase/phosphopantothenate--cysteine ligase CoaBC [Vallitalea sp.]|jgi:phosphopantothenoylcysteine decarboxylase/phosphopantothenate--cysteine ligase|uniref:bifunctional phosphopantothenoylcysteine decarboxylase/phosphopantothenate--cysteine ligase CoaBC n=1 Tax=Vallitalea sp. TaxID=1882829 RepID=UPI0025FA1080|nr:bifunctional phosphopantothenoylcysteine decarboxylase/phosphopantothenate--cysteine ligase CoaBC [Vallitalea sp.]MCT4688174.1 bifunctional phosphopantothenoylcysteine decarboxylase/phosphopantothenate--cysteine ligase CoaBC [Vallitalea sp.]